MSPNRAAPSLALAAYAETWISGAKVIVFGDALSPLPERLIERGARLVQVYDRDAARVAEAAALNPSRQIAYASLDNANAIARDGSFDFGIVEELSVGAGADGMPLSALRRALGRRGMALIAARNPEISRTLIPATASADEPLGYYELYELVSQHFDEVRMLGQTAFVGYAVADFGAAEDSDVRLDTAFLPGGAEEPEWFLALVSTLPVTSEAFSVIQIPLAELPAAAAPSEQIEAEQSARQDELERLERALQQAQARIAELERQSPARDGGRESQAVQQQKELLRQELQAQHRQELQAQRRELEALQAELSKREQWLAGLEARATTADQRADDAQAQLEHLTQRATEAIAQKKQLEAQLQEARSSKRALEESQAGAQRRLEELEQGSGANARNFAELERRAITLSTQLDELTAQLDASERQQREREATDDQAASELRELEAQLIERGTEVARLTHELEQTERFGRQLIQQLEELKAARNSESAPRDLERLARRNAELEADLEAARWTISSLGANVPGSLGPGAATASSAVQNPASASPRREDGSLDTSRRSAD